VSRPSLLFFTYYRLVPTGQMGILKRCLRLMRHLVGDFEIHLVNYGPLPEEDALFAELRPKISVHDPAGDGLGRHLVAILEEVRPAAVVHGETPLRGSMRLSHRVASALETWQIGIENYYGDFVPGFLPSEWPRIDRWLLLGLLDGGGAGGSGGRCAVVPPFVRFPADHGLLPRDRIAILGYDKQTLLTGARLVSRLPATQRVDVLIAPQWRSFLAGLGLDLSRPGLRVLVLPGDEELYSTLSRAKLVVGKAGFQQVVESISLGAPIVCQLCGGGVEAPLLPSYLRPFVRFVAGEQDLQDILFDVAGWLLATPTSPWSDLRSQVADPAAHAAQQLRELIGQGPVRIGASAVERTA
jgi:hypothetical protein